MWIALLAYLVSGLELYMQFLGTIPVIACLWCPQHVIHCLQKVYNLSQRHPIKSVWTPVTQLLRQSSDFLLHQTQMRCSISVCFITLTLHSGSNWGRTVAIGTGVTSHNHLLLEGATCQMAWIKKRQDAWRRKGTSFRKIRKTNYLKKKWESLAGTPETTSPKKWCPLGGDRAHLVFREYPWGR